MSSLQQLRDGFNDPQVDYRSVPFWAWNSRLEKEELVRQLKEMKKQGMGGAFLHSREGLETVYMGQEWMDCVRETVRAGEELGLHIWLYDEDRWPSGFAGGMVQARGQDAFRAKGLTMEVREQSGREGVDDAVLLYRAVIQERNLLFAKRLPLDDACQLNEGEVLLVFRVEISVFSEWFNHEAPPDNLNPETVQAFIDITYEAYKKEVGEHFGKTVKGIFTDEPSLHDRHCKFTEGRGWIPWSWSFPDFFKERRGYDFFDVAPYVYFDGELSSQARHDYWRTITERFSESYSKQLGHWCAENGIAFTGHFLWENNMGTATRVCGAVMPNYRFQQVPGVDLLTEKTDEYITMKQCTSVANQYGRKFVLSETYGCTGWGFTFEGQRWLGDFQYVLGVNLRSQHLALYSIKGCRKRDYPPVFNYNTSWWKYNHVVEQYFARLGAVLTEGKPVRDVLVLHPSTTAWSMLGTGPYGFPARGKDKDVSKLNEFGNAFNDFLGRLLRAHFDYDIGDEIILAETGEVRGNLLGVNLTQYAVVVIPPIRTLLNSTYRLLVDFLEAGGIVISTGDRISMLEGRFSDKCNTLYEHNGWIAVQDVNGVIEALEERLPRHVRLLNEEGREAEQLLVMLRDNDESRTLFVVNNDREQSVQTQIELEGTGVVEQWDALTGEIKPIPVVHENGFVRFITCLGPADSKLYLLKTGEACLDEQQLVVAEKIPDSTVELGPMCRFTRTLANALVLDKCSFRFGDQAQWSPETDVWQAQRAIREALGMVQIYGNGLEQRYKWIYQPHPADGTPAQFAFTFEVECLPKETVHLVLEEAEHFQIELNGILISNEVDGWFLDRAFHTIPLKGLKIGTNELVLSCHYLNKMEVEDCYLIGSFGVSPERIIVAEPDQLHFGDWTKQGYFHYCGSMVYHFDVFVEKEKFAKYMLEVADSSAVTIEVRVNKVTAAHIPWRAANLIDLSKALQEGYNEIEIEVMSSPRNLLGPFHNIVGDPVSTSWESFRKRGEQYVPGYNVKPYGLFGGIRLHQYVK